MLDIDQRTPGSGGVQTTALKMRLLEAESAAEITKSVKLEQVIQITKRLRRVLTFFKKQLAGRGSPKTPTLPLSSAGNAILPNEVIFERKTS